MSINKKIVLAVIFLIFIALGLPDHMISSVWPKMRFDISSELSSIGLVTLTAYIMTLISTYTAPELLNRFSTSKIVLFSVLLNVLTVLAISLVNHLTVLVLLSIPLGFSAGAIDLSINHYVSVHYDEKHMSFLHSFYGVGALLGPFIISQTLRLDNWRLGYQIVAVILLLIGLSIIVSMNLWEHEDKEHKETYHKKTRLKDVLATKRVKTSLLIFLLYVGFEASVAVLVASYGSEFWSFLPYQAALLTMTYLLGLTLGRLLSGFITNKHNLHIVSIVSAVLMIIPSIGFAFVLPHVLIYGLVLISGIGSGPIFPNMMSANTHVFDKSILSRVMSLQMIIGYLGFGLLTPILGVLIDRVDLIVYPFILSIEAILLLILTISFYQYKYAKKTAL